MSKRFFWLKLQEGFFGSKRIKKLRKISDTYVIIYLKMQLLAMNKGGILTYTGLEQDFSEELALDLDEEPENVKETLDFLLTHDLTEYIDDDNLFFPYAAENTGSETDSAKRVREHRARQDEKRVREFRQRAALQSNDDVTQVKRLCNGEKEKIKNVDIEHIGERECGKPTLSTGFQQGYQQSFEEKREAALRRLQEEREGRIG